VKIVLATILYQAVTVQLQLVNIPSTPHFNFQHCSEACRPHR